MFLMVFLQGLGKGQLWGQTHLHNYLIQAASSKSSHSFYGDGKGKWWSCIRIIYIMETRYPWEMKGEYVARCYNASICEWQSIITFRETRSRNAFTLGFTGFLNCTINNNKGTEYKISRSRSIQPSQLQYLCKNCHNTCNSKFLTQTWSNHCFYKRTNH